MRKVIIDLTYPNDRETLHSYLKEKLSLPSYYGNNLDALHDCLTSVTEPLCIGLKVPFADETDPDLYPYLENTVKVFADAEEENKNLGVIYY